MGIGKKEMTLPWNRYRDLAAQLQADLDEAQADRDNEHAKRIAAETLATERLRLLNDAQAAIQRAETAREEAVQGRIKTMEAINTKLFASVGPERSPDIKDFRPLVPITDAAMSPINSHRASLRKSDMELALSQIKAVGKKHGVELPENEPVEATA